MPSLLNEFLDLLLPVACARCRRALEAPRALCPNCHARLSKIPVEACARCQQQPSRDPLGLCARCRAQPSPLAACRSTVWFEGDALRWIHDFKYPGKGLAACDPRPQAVVTDWLLDTADIDPDSRPELLVPVPLHPRRLRERGFNPAGLLARSASRAWHIAWDPTALRRLRDTPSQTHLDRAARRKNVRSAFRANGRLPAHVCLLDDVVTTGATLEAAALALRAGGAERVTARCAARTPARETRPPPAQ